jgi:hypothetical protein
VQAGEEAESFRGLVAMLALVDGVEQQDARRGAGDAQPVVERAPRAFAQFPLDDRQEVSMGCFQNTLSVMATGTVWGR